MYIAGFSAFLLCAPVAGVAAADAIPEIEVIESVTEVDASGNYSGIKSLMPTGDLPLTVESLSSRILENVRSRNVESLIDGYSSGSTSPGEGGLVSAIILRGFTDAAFYRNGLNDSLGTIPLRDVANIETIEILKGANSALYGPGEPGGTVNIVTKQPEFERAHSIQANLGSYDKYRIEVDSTGPLAGSGKLAYRMIAAYENANSFRDTIESNRVFAAPSLRWRPARHWDLLAELEYIQHKTPFDTGLVAVDGAFPLPLSRYLGEPGLDKTRLQAVTTSLSAAYEPADTWNISAKILWQNTDIDGFKLEPDEIDEGDPGELLLARVLQREIDDADGFSTQLEVSGKLQSGPLQHHVLAGYEYISAANLVVVDSSDIDINGFELNIRDPDYGQAFPALSPARDTDESINQHSFYLQDFISIGEKFSLLFGSRLDKTDIKTRDDVVATRINQDDNEISSRVAAMYSLNKNLSLFISYSESSETNEGLTPQGNPLLPSIGTSLEAGIKFRHDWSNFAMDISVYDIEQTNIAVDAPGAPGFEIQTARQVSNGLELHVSLKPVKWMYTDLKYAYTDAEIRDDPELPDGTPPINVPRHKLILASFFSFKLRKENDLQAGISASFRSKQGASIDPDELGVYLPGYWTGDIFVNYLLTPRISLGFNISNFLNTDYLASSQVDLLHLHPGEPVTFSGSVRISY